MLWFWCCICLPQAPEELDISFTFLCLCFPIWEAQKLLSPCVATLLYSGHCVSPFCSLEDAGRAAFSCVVSFLWRWLSSRKQSQ